MAATVGSLNVNATLQTAQFDKNVDKMRGQLKGLQASFSRVGANITKAGAIFTAGVTLPLVAFGKQAFKTATDAQELQAAFNETFGSLSKGMNAWAEATGNAMGRSTREIQEGAQAFGLYFNQAAETRAEAAKMSQTFTVLAQDLASFHNTGVDEALLALRSGLSGESEPMRRFGVFLNEAAVAAKAAEMGFEKVNGKLTDQQKIMARAAIIMDATKNAQGDVGRTAGSTANQLRASAAAWEELQIIVGTKLLPVLTPLISTLGGILDKFSKLSPATQTWIVGVAAVGAALGPIMMVLGPLVMGFGALLPLIVKLGPAFVALRVAALALLANPVILGAAVLIGGIYLAWKNWDKITAIVQRVVQAVKTWLSDRLAAVLDAAKKKVEAFASPFVWLYNKLVGNSVIPELIDGIAAQMARLDSVMVQPAQNAAAKTAEAFQRLASLLDRLFPEAARYNQFRQELVQLEADAKRLGLTAQQTAAAIAALRQEYTGQAFGSNEPSADLLNTPPLVDLSAGPVIDFTETLKGVAPVVNEIGAAFQNITRNVVDGLSYAITDVIMGVQSLGKAFADIARSIIAQIIQMTVRMLIFRLLMGVLGGGAGLTGGAAFAATSGLPGFASGGSFKIAGLQGIDKNLLSINGVPAAMVSRGEQIDVIPENDRNARGGTVHYHFKGNLMTPEFWARIHEGDTRAAQAGVRGGAHAALRVAARPKLMGR